MQDSSTAAEKLGRSSVAWAPAAGKWVWVSLPLYAVWLLVLAGMVLFSWSIATIPQPTGASPGHEPPTAGTVPPPRD